MRDKILFVDDEQKMLKYFDLALREDFDILTADSVNSAIAILQQQHSDIAVIITDQRMPERMGIELLQYAQNHHPNIVRMLTTAFCEIDNAIDAINSAEVFRYIAKPWDIDALSLILQQGLDRFNAKLAIKAQSPQAAEFLFAELEEDCNAWFAYSAYAYGNEAVYRSGLEALANKYYRQATSDFDAAQSDDIQTAINELIENNFLNSDKLKEVKSQSKQGFTIADKKNDPNLH